MKITITLLSLVAFFIGGFGPKNSMSFNEMAIEYLFNGKDLAGWYSYQRNPESTSEVPGITRDSQGKYLKPLGLNNDPLKVFSVAQTDGKPAIRISGETFGILITEKEYENYYLKLEFKWGEKKFPPRTNQKMDSGILYHSIGKEGAWDNVWMKSLECQVQEGDCGDFITVDSTFADIAAVKKPNNRQYYQKGATLVAFGPGNTYCDKSADYENPKGEWNTIEIYTYNGTSIHVVNGKVNMRVYNTQALIGNKKIPLTKGKIQLQSEGAEIFYRNITIQTINKIPDNLL